MAKATLTIAIGGTYDNKAVSKAEKALKDLNTEAARHSGGITESFTKAGDSIIGLGTDMEKTGAKLSGLGTSITKATAPIAAIGAASVKLASDYESSVAKVYTIMDKSKMGTEEMAKSILDLSTKTGKGATELADATYQALSASVETDKVAGFVEKSVKLAKSGFTSTATAVDTLTTVINAYGLSAEDAGEISDKLVQTQNKGKTTVDELSQSIGNVIPTAAAYNVNLDNLCGAYVTLTKQGINTANSTTAINGMLTELADSGSGVAKILREKTGKSFGELMAEGASLGDVIGILNDSVDGDSEAFANLWGNVRASKGALAIANAGTEEFNSTLTDMANSTGLCDKALEDLQTPAAKAEKAINAMKNTGIQLGEKIIEAAVPSLDRLAELAQGLYEWFGSLDDATKENIVRFGALAVAVGPAVTVFGKLYGGVGSLLAKMGGGLQTIGTFGAAMKAAEAEMRTAGASSVTLGDKLKGAADKTGLLSKATGLLKGSLVAIGIAAAVAAVGLIVSKYKEWKEHTEKVEKATKGLEAAVGNAKIAYDEYEPSVKGATKALEANAASAEEALDSQAKLADQMGKTFGEVGTNAAMVDRYAQTISELGNKGDLTNEEMVRLQAAVDGFNELTGAGIEITDDMTGELNASKDAILAVAAAYKKEAKAAAAREMLTEINKQMLQDELALKGAKDKLKKAEEDYQRALKEYPDAAGPYADAVASAKQEVSDMEAAIQSAGKSEQELVDLISESPKSFSTLEGALESCGVSIGDFGELTDEELADLESGFDGTLSSIVKTCIEQGRNIPEGLKQGIEENADDPVQSTGDMITAALNKAKDILQSHSPSKAMYRIGADVDKGLGNGIRENGEKPKGAMETVAASLIRALNGAKGDARQQGKDTATGYADGVGSKSAYSQGQNLAQTARNGLGAVSMYNTGWNAVIGYENGMLGPKASNAGQNVAVNARDGMKNVSAYNTGWNFAVGFGKGINGPDIYTAAYNIGNSALSAIKRALGIKSPSKKAMEVGEYFAEGAIIGMQSMEGAVEEESARLSEAMDLAPGQYGYTAGQYGAYGLRQAPVAVTIAPTVYVSAKTEAEAMAVGSGLAESLYTELTRKMGGELWAASYSVA